MSFQKICLTEEEIKAIQDTAKEILGNNLRVWIFGSRVNNTYLSFGTGNSD